MDEEHEIPMVEASASEDREAEISVRTVMNFIRSGVRNWTSLDIEDMERGYPSMTGDRVAEWSERAMMLVAEPSGSAEGEPTWRLRDDARQLLDEKMNLSEIERVVRQPEPNRSEFARLWGQMQSIL